MGENFLILMKIGIDIRPLMDARYSGVSEYTYNLVKEILKLDTENEYRLFYNCFGDCPNIPDFKAPNIKLIKHNYPNKFLNYLLFKFLNYPKIDQELGVDIFFMPHINFIGLADKATLVEEDRMQTPLAPLSRGGGKGAKSLITVHDLSFLRYPEFFSARKNFWHKMINVRKFLQRFDWIVAVSENTKRDIVELCHIPGEKVKVVYSGVGEEYRKIFNFQFSMFNEFPIKKFSNFDPEEKKALAVKKKYGLPDKFILYLGTIEPRKNIKGIIAAYGEARFTCHESRDYKLVIAGGKGWKYKSVFSAWEKSKFKNDIIFLDYIDSADRPYLYNLASVFIYPSFYEGFGLPVLEAMASGLPVICGHSSSLPEVAGEAAFMVNPNDINEIAAGIKEILTNENLRSDLATRGLRRAKRFSWEKTAKEYLALFTLKNRK